MTAKQTLVSLLTNLPAVQDIAAGRVFKGAAPQKSFQFPCLTYSLVSERRLKVLAGDAGLAAYRFQVVCLSPDETDCDQLATAIKTLIGPQAGVQWVWHDETADDYEPPQELQDRGMKHTSIDLIVWM